MKQLIFFILLVFYLQSNQGFPQSDNKISSTDEAYQQKLNKNLVRDRLQNNDHLERRANSRSKDRSEDYSAEFRIDDSGVIVIENINTNSIERQKAVQKTIFNIVS